MTWTEIGLDLSIVIACYFTIPALFLVWSFVFAPSRLKREAKRQAGQKSLDKVLTQNAGIAAGALDRLMDTDEDADNV